MQQRPQGFRMPARIARAAQFSEAGSAPAVISTLEAAVTDLANDLSDPAWQAWGERLCAAVLLLAQGDTRRVREVIALARQDWRDVLVAADLADADWPQRLTASFGPPDEDH